MQPPCFRIANARARALLESTLNGMPALACDSPIRVLFRPRLTMFRGRLRSGGGRGTPVHAGSDLRRRTMTLESELIGDAGELRRIFVHETFHFAWYRLGNPRRAAWEMLLATEIVQRRPGELGWSSESRKISLEASDHGGRTRRWREYACESFCDTAAWMYSGVPQHDEYTLPCVQRRRRAECVTNLLGDRPVRV